MRTGNLALFINVVKQGSFSSVAKSMDLPRANVSRRIAELEHVLGVTLFNRTTRHLSLTPMGKLYYKDVCVAMDALNRAQSNLSAATHAPSGRVKWGLPPTADTRSSQLAADFQAIYPDVEVEIFITSDSYSNFFDLGLDVAIHAGELAPSDLLAHQFATSSKVFVASPTFTEQYGIPLSLEELSGLPSICMRWPDGELENEWVTVQGRVKVTPKLTTNSLDLMQKMLLSGSGVGFLPDLLANPHIHQGTLINILPHATSHPLGAYLVYPKREGLPLATQLFIDYLKTELPRQILLSHNL